VDRIQKLIQSVALQASQKRQRANFIPTHSFRHVNHGVLVEFSNGRKQHVMVSHQGEHYLLISVILKRGHVEKIGRSTILPFIWQRNRETNLVAFSLDKQGRLIGSIEQLTKTADVNELHMYLEHLAQECDQLQYLLSGPERSQN